MQRVEVFYRVGPILLATVGFGVCAAWIALGPETSGAVGRALGSRAEPSLLAIIAVGIGVVFTSIFGFHLVRVILGYPAIAIDGDTLFVNVLPFRKYPISSISSIQCDDASLVICFKNGRLRSVNPRLLKDFDVRSQELMREINK